MVLETLRERPSEDQLRVCTILAQHGVPADVVGPMSRLLLVRGSELSIVAALALRRCHPNDLQAASEAEFATSGEIRANATVENIQEALRRGIEQGIPQVLRSNCASALLELVPASTDMHDVAFGVLDQVDLPYKFAILQGIFRSGAASAGTLKHLSSLAEDESLSAELRQAAFAAIGSAGRHRPDIIRRITTTDRADSVIAVLSGLQSRPITDLAVIAHVAELLKSPFRRVRLQAVWTLGSARPLPSEVLMAIGDTRVTDDDRELDAATVFAIQAAGKSAIPLVVALANSGSATDNALVVGLVHNMSLEFLQCLLDFYAEHAFDETVDAVIHARFDIMRNAASELAPYLRGQLNSEPLKAERYLHCLASSGAKDPETVGAVVSCIDESSKTVSELAQAVLMDMGDAVLGTVTEMAANAGKYRKTVLDSVLAHFASQPPVLVRHGSDPVGGEYDPAIVAMCASIDADELLRLFVHVVDAMSATNSTRMDDVVEHLAKRAASKEIPSSLAPKKPQLSMRLKLLRKKLGGMTLFNFSRGRSGGPTAQGLKVYHAARAHLRNRLRPDTSS